MKPSDIDGSIPLADEQLADCDLIEHLKRLDIDIPLGPTQEQMVEYLDKHFRYSTLNSWNLLLSFANCIKISQVNATKEEREAAYALLDVDGPSVHAEAVIEDFDEEHHYDFQIGSNGRSGGYLVLYLGGSEPSDLKSYCRSCGQGNFNEAKTSSDVCGMCGKKRVNYSSPPLRIFTKGAGFSDQWDGLEPEDKLDSAQFYFDIVTDFDRACEAYCEVFISFAMTHTVEERKVMVPHMVKVAVPKKKSRGGKSESQPQT